MTDTDIYDEPPDENEAYENLDEALDNEDGVRPGEGPEGARDLDTDLVVDQTELEEVGAQFDDQDRISLIDGGMDDPDGVGGPPPEAEDPEAGWDVDPVARDAATRDAARPADDVEADGDAVTDGDAVIDGDAVTDAGLDDVPGQDGDDLSRDEDTGVDLDTLADDLPRPGDGR